MKYHLFFSFVIVGIFVLGFVLAAPNAPTGLTISDNVSADYDEGVFFVNWSSGGGDAEANYTIYLFSNDTLYGTATNNSDLGYNFSNSTEANYTFIVETQNVSGTKVNSTTNISIYVDSSAPSISLPTFTNETSTQNSTTLTLNISVSDGLSGLTGSACIIDVNGTNQTIFVDSGWCNTTNGNLTGLTDGNKFIKVYVNDTVGNLGLNDSYVVQADTTAPSVSATCSPTSVNVGDTVTCSCSRSDSGSGIASVSTGSTNPSTSQTGTFSFGCTVTDNAGNVGSSTATYVVEQTYVSPSSGGSSTTTFWTRGTFSISEEEFEQGHTAGVQEKQRFKIKVEEENHYVGVRELDLTTAKIEVSSDAQEKTLAVGEEWKVEITGDNFYDLKVELDSIENNKANIFVQSINEEAPQQPAETSAEGENDRNTGAQITGNVADENEEGGSLSWIWILIGGILIVGIIVFVFFLRKNKNFISSFGGGFSSKKNSHK